MKIMITGGAGFIGTTLTRRLLNSEHEVFCVDNLSTGRAQNINQFIHKRNFYFCKADLLEDDLIGSCYLDSDCGGGFLGDIGFDQIYHLASPASPPKYQEDPIKTFRVNTEGTLKVLEFAKRCGAKVLFASTSEVYGDPLVHPQHEEYRGNVNINGIRSCYDVGKMGGETLCCDFYRTHGTKVHIARIFNTYGPYMDPNDGRVVSNMICQAIKGEDLTVFGEGTQSRSFTFVSDLVDGLIKLMNSNVFAMPVNLGNTDEFTVKELALKLILDFFWEKELSIVHKPLPIDDPRQRKPDISRASSLLDWKPTTSLDEGLKKTIPYFKEELKK